MFLVIISGCKDNKKTFVNDIKEKFSAFYSIFWL